MSFGDLEDLDDDAGLVPLGEVREAVREGLDTVALARPVRGPEPHTLESERSLLAGCLLDPEALDRAIAGGLESRHFFRPAHGELWATLRAMRGAGEPIDSITVTEALRAAGRLEAVGGAQAIAYLEAIGFTSAHVESYARHIVEAATARELKRLGEDIAAAAAARSGTTAELLEELQRRAGAIRVPQRSGFTAELERARDELALGSMAKRRRWTEPVGQSALELLEADMPITPSAVTGLVGDKAFAVLGGDPKGGKTWIGTSIAVSVASGTHVFEEFRVNKPGPVLMLCLEDGVYSLRNRLRAVCAGAELEPRRALRRLRYESRPHIDLCDDDDLAGILASCRVFEREMGEPLGLLYVDPLADAHTGEENSNDDMRAVMRRVRRLRDVLACPVVIAHHLTKDNGKQTSRKEAALPPAPGSLFSKFRGAGAIRGSYDAGIAVDTRVRSPGQLKMYVDVEMRDGRSAGLFGLELAIEDDAHGAAERATWRFVRDPKELLDGSTPEDHGPKVSRVLGALRLEWMAAQDEQRPAEPLSATVIATRTGVRRHDVSAVLQVLQARGRITDNGKKGSATGFYYLDREVER